MCYCSELFLRSLAVIFTGKLGVQFWPRSPCKNTLSIIQGLVEDYQFTAQ